MSWLSVFINGFVATLLLGFAATAALLAGLGAYGAEGLKSRICQGAHLAGPGLVSVKS